MSLCKVSCGYQHCTTDHIRPVSYLVRVLTSSAHYLTSTPSSSVLSPVPPSPRLPQPTMPSTPTLRSTHRPHHSSNGSPSRPPSILPIRTKFRPNPLTGGAARKLLPRDPHHHLSQLPSEPCSPHRHGNHRTPRVDPPTRLRLAHVRRARRDRTHQGSRLCLRATPV